MTLSGVDWKREPIGVITATLKLRVGPNPEQVSPDLDSVQDAAGNPGLMQQNYGGNRRFILPPGLGPWRARYTLRRSVDFPWPLSEMNMLLDGEFTAADKPLKLTPTAFFTSLGTLTLTGEARRTSSDEGANEKVELHFKWHLQSPTALPQAAQEVHDGPWVLFVDGKPVTAFPPSTIGNYGPAVKNLETIWKGAISPGTKFQVGVLKTIPPQTVEFTFDPPPYPGR